MNNSIQNLDMLGAAPSLEEVMQKTHNDEKRRVAVETCRRKQVFRSKADARNAVIARNSRRHGMKALRLTPYECPVCGHFHVTSQHP